tara:strand:- start:236 stop:1690 length:1455 start_codon:yes stop_codon:yes gene_type:complete
MTRTNIELNNHTSNNIKIIEVEEQIEEPIYEEEIDQCTYLMTLFINLLGIFGSLYGFLFALALMGDSFKVLGGRTAGNLFKNVDNPIAGLMIGILATVLVQSSSTSTSVMVGMVGADIITVQTAIPLIMGANIGTSVTNSIVSIGQMQDKDQRQNAFSGAVVHDFFNILCVLIFLPIECITHMLYYWSDLLTGYMEGTEAGTFKSPLKIIVSPLTKLILQVDKKKINKISEGEIKSDDVDTLIKGGVMKDMDDQLAGVICLTCSLVLLCIFLYGLVTFLKRTVMGAGEGCIRYSLQFSNTWWGGYLNILLGILLTISVQSSSVTTSALTPLVGLGIISLEQMYPITLGANIGTTCTGLLAALVTGKVNALQIALCHLSFNIFGVMLLYPFPCTSNIPINMAKFYGKIARTFKWFPFLHILFTFIVCPLIFLGLSILFELNAIGIVFGTLICLGITGGLGKLGYWYYYEEGENWLMLELEKEVVE